MKVSAKFTEQGLQLVLRAESEQEKKMVGACINQPFEPVAYGSTEVPTTLLNCKVEFDGYWSNKSVDTIILSVYRQENK